MSIRAILLASLGLFSCQASSDSKTAALANRVAIWLDHQAVTRDGHVDWPIDVRTEEASFSPNLYSGTTGVLLFYLEHHAASGRQASLDMARHAGDTLIAKLADLDILGAGLYTGAAGIGFALHELHRSAEQEEFRIAAHACLDYILDSAREVDAGLTWGASSDIISGDAGIGLYLLWATQALDRPDALNAAARAGKHLFSLGQMRGNGMAWQMTPDYAREMPGFSHGTAGIAYFLACLHEATGDADSLKAAVAGGRLLQTISDQRGLVYHNQTAPDLFYLGWCHGPAGTSRLFLALQEITGDDSWGEWVRRAAASMLSEDLALSRPEGFWNNHGQCCGSAGLADFYLQNADLIGKGKAEAMVARLLREIEQSATEYGSGVAWTHAEHRLRPEELSTQTGHTQGAAGIGLFLLHRVAEQRGRPRRIILPDA